jgi:hypothetical protein
MGKASDSIINDQLEMLKAERELYEVAWFLACESSDDPRKKRIETLDSAHELLVLGFTLEDLRDETGIQASVAPDGNPQGQA